MKQVNISNNNVMSYVGIRNFSDAIAISVSGSNSAAAYLTHENAGKAEMKKCRAHQQEGASFTATVLNELSTQLEKRFNSAIAVSEDGAYLREGKFLPNNLLCIVPDSALPRCLELQKKFKATQDAAAVTDGMQKDWMSNAESEAVAELVEQYNYFRVCGINVGFEKESSIFRFTFVNADGTPAQGIQADQEGNVTVESGIIVDGPSAGMKLDNNAISGVFKLKVMYGRRYTDRAGQQKVSPNIFYIDRSGSSVKIQNLRKLVQGSRSMLPHEEVLEFAEEIDD